MDRLAKLRFGRRAARAANLSTAARLGLAVFLAATGAIASSAARAQPGPDDPPATYEVQIDGESFRVESNQRPVKVESKLKPGTTYTLAVRVAMTQSLRLNSVRMEYGMWAKVIDDKAKDIRHADIINDIGFHMRITDMGLALGDKQADKLLETMVEGAGKTYKDAKATELKKVGPRPQKFGQSSGKGVKITYKDDGGVAHTTMIFVLSGAKYTIAAEAELRDQYFEDAMPWIKAALGSIRPLH